MLARFRLENDFASIHGIKSENNYICVRMKDDGLDILALAYKNTTEAGNPWVLDLNYVYPEGAKHISDLKERFDVAEGLSPFNIYLKEILSQYPNLITAIHDFEVQIQIFEAARSSLPPPSGGTPRPSKPFFGT